MTAEFRRNADPGHSCDVQISNRRRHLCRRTERGYSGTDRAGPRRRVEADDGATARRDDGAGPSFGVAWLYDDVLMIVEMGGADAKLDPVARGGNPHEVQAAPQLPVIVVGSVVPGRQPRGWASVWRIGGSDGDRRRDALVRAVSARSGSGGLSRRRRPSAPTCAACGTAPG